MKTLPELYDGEKNHAALKYKKIMQDFLGKFVLG